MSLFKSSTTSVLLSTLVLLVSGAFFTSESQASSLSYSTADYCTTQEYIALGYNAADAGLQCRYAARKTTIGQHRDRKGNVAAYDVQTCNWREHTGEVEYKGSVADDTIWINDKNWHRFTPKRCSVKKVPPSGRAASVKR